MQNVPKIVRERLTTATPAANHPDADVLTAFAERSLPELERTVVLDHLARCGDCRDIVALALPAMEPVETAVRPSSRGWVTWPALRWGFVAAGVVAIAALGVLQYQQRLQPATMASKQSARLEVAANEPKKSVAPFGAAAPSEKKEKLQSPAAPAFADSIDAANAVANEKKSVARVEAPPASALPPQARSFPGVAGGMGNSLPHGPRLANQWQQQNTAQNQIPAPAPPPPFAKQQHADADVSVNGRIPAASQTVQVSGAAPAIATEDAGLSARQGQSEPPAQPSGENSAYLIGRAKLPVREAAPGQIGGSVVDPTGAVVSNARITLSPSKTGETVTAVTNSQGVWLIAGLPSGNYKAQAEAPGFKTTVLDFNYDANHPSTYSFTLSPGSVSELVEVSSAQNAQVQAETATIGGPITSRELGQAPVTGRNVTQTTTLPALLPRWAINASGALQRSFDQGNSWQTVDVNANPAPFAGATSLQVAANTSRAKVKDADKTLKRDAATLTFRAVAAAGSDVWAGGSAGALYHSMDAGNHWTRVVPAFAGAILTGDIIRVEFPDPQHGKLSTSTAEIWVTSDDGQTWQKQ